MKARMLLLLVLVLYAFDSPRMEAGEDSQSTRAENDSEQSRGIPILREFRLKIERLTHHNSRIYATLRLTYRGHSDGRRSNGVHSVELAEFVSPWAGATECFHIVHVPKQFARRSERFFDCYPFAGIPPRSKKTSLPDMCCFGFFSWHNPEVSLQGIPYFDSACWDIDITDHFDMTKASEQAYEFAKHAGEIQIQCLITYRDGNEQKGGLVSTH